MADSLIDQMTDGIAAAITGHGAPFSRAELEDSVKLQRIIVSNMYGPPIDGDENSMWFRWKERLKVRLDERGL